MIGPSEERPILFFDGVCNFCNGTVNFIIRHDKKEHFLFAPLQSDKGREVLHDMNPKDDSLQSVIISYKGKIYEKSDAALQVFRILGGLWSVFLAGYIIPRFIRDGIYNFIAAHRYKWFGKRDACMVPSSAIRARFLS